MKRVGVLPSLVTLANGYCGVLAIYKTHDGEYYVAAVLILLAMVFDVLDGVVARRTGFTSSFGAYLDSLSDAISFGLAPAFLAKAAVEDACPGVWKPKLLAFFTAVFALGALLRLARYNVEHASGEGTDRDGKEVTRFAGIPTPGAAGVVASLVFLAYDESRLLDYTFVLAVLPGVCAILALLMVSRVPYDHFGNRVLKGRRDFAYLFRVVVVLALITLFREECAAVGFVAYSLSGLALLPWRGREKEPPDVDEDRPRPTTKKKTPKIPEGL